MQKKQAVCDKFAMKDRAHPLSSSSSSSPT